MSYQNNKINKIYLIFGFCFKVNIYCDGKCYKKYIKFNLCIVFKFLVYIKLSFCLLSFMCMFCENNNRLGLL